MGLPSLDSFSASARHKVWRADELGLADAQVLSTGHAALDAELPGGGWPVGAMTELLQSEPEAHSWHLLLPALARAVQGGRGPVALIGAPHEPFGPALGAAGLPVESLLWIRSEPPNARLWACEQALRCADVAAVLAWLPQARVGELRRLQLAAAQHEALLFVFRPTSAAAATSPARLRLQLALCEDDTALLDVHILKRRGPPLASAVQLPARSERMSTLLAGGQFRRKLLRREQGVLPVEQGATVVRIDFQEKRHAMDRLALAA
ncbi:translesion DNA synthesis-associated protein ImuA [Variovorax sp. J22P168]|uniref:translesion DNA synthesis-associated protein ImuA n=1 Tax=Variovorax jilinensis TaxID=3053513 RepID=UPI002576F92A|nr:translesion DNA synthesis-associated protein ImuA [Variovorax sp. J22P168]MDM0011947.1 translesion DNA synthesis-associated protein ImuA [Variovorax sp. J22P168]